MNIFPFTAEDRILEDLSGSSKKNTALYVYIVYLYSYFSLYLAKNGFPAPDLIISSTYRNGDSGSHGRNNAIDVALS